MANRDWSERVTGWAVVIAGNYWDFVAHAENRQGPWLGRAFYRKYRDAQKAVRELRQLSLYSRIERAVLSVSPLKRAATKGRDAKRRKAR